MLIGRRILLLVTTVDAISLRYGSHEFSSGQLVIFYWCLLSFFTYQFQCRKGKDLYLWMAKCPGGPSVKFLVSAGNFLIRSLS